MLGERATAKRSQPYYLDITSRYANKGVVADYLSHHLDVPLEEIATIGDLPNDVLMFKRSGFSIAMGNASDEVKAQTLQSKTCYRAENRFAFNRLAVVHGRLHTMWIDGTEFCLKPQGAAA